MASACAHVGHEGGLVGEADARGAVGLRQLDEVRVLAHVDLAVALVPEQLLPLADHAQVPVVHDEHLDRDLLLGAGGELLHVHLHRAVAGDADDGVVRTPHLSAHRRRQPEAHRAQAAGVDPPAGPGEVVALGGPHLVLADVRDDDRVAAGRLVQRLDHVLGLDLGVRGVGVGERVALLPLVDPGPPLLQARRVGLERPVLRGEPRQDVPGIADDRDVGRDVLGDLGRIDVDVDELGARRELRQLAGDPVVEAGADGHDQVGLVHRVVGGAGPVHAQHAQPLVVRARGSRPGPSPCR